jgi:hypothetical protein
MGRLDDLRQLKNSAMSKAHDADLAARAAHVTSELVVKAADAMDGAEAVAQRAGLTKRNGDVSKRKVARAAFTPTKTARTHRTATSEEIKSRRGTEPVTDQVPPPESSAPTQ